MNRGSDAAEGMQCWQRLTSMRPRFMNRGSAVDLARYAMRRNSFNEAPIHESGKFPLFSQVA